MSVVILPGAGDELYAECDLCPWHFDLRSETMLQHLATQHEETHTRWQAEVVPALEAAQKAAGPAQHVHGPQCTWEVCGVGPRRADLIRASVARSGR